MAIIKGTNSANNLYGTASSDTLYGYGGDDYLSAGSGNDNLYGGAGNDDLVGGFGVNNYFGGSGSDWFIMSARGSATVDDYIADFEFDIDRVSVSAWGISDFSQIAALLSTDANGDAYFNAYYNGYNNFLTIGEVAPSQLQSADFIYSNSGARNSVGTSYSDVMFGSRSNDTLNGAAGNDKLLGGIGNDVLLGGAGVDFLVGGAGADRLSGGSSGDTFIFKAASDSIPGVLDVITDFQEDIDHISLSAIDANAVVAGNQAFAWIGAAGFSNPGQLQYSFSGSNTLVSGNTDYDSASEFRFMISGQHHMIAQDFVL